MLFLTVFDLFILFFRDQRVVLFHLFFHDVLSSLSWTDMTGIDLY